MQGDGVAAGAGERLAASVLLAGVVGPQLDQVLMAGREMGQRERERDRCAGATASRSDRTS